MIIRYISRVHKPSCSPMEPNIRESFLVGQKIGFFLPNLDNSFVQVVCVCVYLPWKWELNWPAKAWLLITSCTDWKHKNVFVDILRWEGLPTFNIDLPTPDSDREPRRGDTMVKGGLEIKGGLGKYFPCQGPSGYQPRWPRQFPSQYQPCLKPHCNGSK